MCRTIVNRGEGRPINLKFRGYNVPKKPYFFSPNLQQLQQQQQQQQQAPSLQNIPYYGQPGPYLPPQVGYSARVETSASLSQLSASAASNSRAAPSKHARQVSECDEASAADDDRNRSMVCAICNVDTGSYNLNYGANTCLSCRAFFRRAVQKTRNPQFTCKNGGNCEMNEETRRACKACRYQACLNAGMLPECVMKGTEVQQRFAKYIQRKRGIDKKATTMAALTEVKDKKIKRERKRRRRNGKEEESGDAKKDLLKIAVKEIVQVPPTEQEQWSQQQPEPQQPQQQQQLSFMLPSTSNYEMQAQDMPDFLNVPSEDMSMRPAAPANEILDGDIVALFNLDYLSSDDSDHSGDQESSSSPSYAPAASSPSISDSGHESMGDISDGVDGCMNEIPITLFEEVIQNEPVDCPEKPVFDDKKKEPPKLEETKSEPMEVEDMEEKARHVRRTWVRACEENRPTRKVVAEVFKALTSTERLPNVLVEELKLCYKRTFMAFASEQEELAQFSSADQQALLDRNGDMFMHYIFARILSADVTSGEQLQWMLLLEDAPCISQPSLVRSATLQDLQQNFLDSGSCSQYCSLARKFGNSSPFKMGFPCTGSVALICLLSTDDGLEDTLSIPRAKVDVLRAKALERADWAQEAYGWEGALSLMEAQACIMDLYRLNKSNSLMVDCEKILSMPELRNIFHSVAAGKEGQEEEEWVARQLVDFDLVFNRISFGPEFVKECVMYSFGVPLSKHFFPQATRVFVERLKAVMMHHKEFRQLPLEQREAAWKNGVLAGAVVMRASLENCSCGNQQFDISFGADDKDRMHELFARQGVMLPKHINRPPVARWD